jgi:hypothetical protein
MKINFIIFSGFFGNLYFCSPGQSKTKDRNNDENNPYSTSIKNTLSCFYSSAFPTGLDMSLSFDSTVDILWDRFNIMYSVYIFV